MDLFLVMLLVQLVHINKGIFKMAVFSVLEQFVV
jgi:hypothetical protein